MFGLFKRKAPPPSPAPAMASAQGGDRRATPDAIDAPFEWNAVRTSEAVVRLLGQFMRTGKFQGGLDGAEGFNVQRMPNGMEVAASEGAMTGAVMSETAVGLSMAGAAPMHVALVCLEPTFAHYLKHTAKWDMSDDEAGTNFSTVVPLASPFALSVTCIAEPVDPLFSGTMVRGTTLTLKVVKAS